LIGVDYGPAMGIRRAISNYLDHQAAADVVLFDRQPEADEAAERYQAAQRDRPIWRRGLGWWIGEGVPVAVVTVFGFTLLGLAIEAVLSLL
jgi:hypothetical protein